MGQNLSTQRIDRHGPVRKTGKMLPFFGATNFFRRNTLKYHILLAGDAVVNPYLDVDST